MWVTIPKVIKSVMVCRFDYNSTLAFDFYAICFSIKYGSESTFRCLFPLMADSINSS